MPRRQTYSATRMVDGRSLPDGNRRRLTQAERTALSDTRMFNAAMQLISQQGANRTTLREICETAGYSRGLANYRFGSKDNFLQELLKHFNHAWVEQLRAYTDGKRGRDAFMAAIDALENFLAEYDRYMRGSYTIWYESIGGENAIKAQLAENHRRYRADVELWMREGIEQGTVRADLDVENFAFLYVTFVSGTIYQWLVAPESVKLKSVFEYFRGIVRRELSPAERFSGDGK
ncbi:MAG TPA: TetR/AcrR family transcriptional regulator [Pseudomonadales bacterium]